MKNILGTASALQEKITTAYNEYKWKSAAVLLVLLGGMGLKNAHAQGCCGLEYSMLNGGFGRGTMYTNVFSPNNGWTKDANIYQLGRQGQASHFRSQAGVEVWQGGQKAENGTREYTGRFPKAYGGIGVSFLPAESFFLPYIFANGGYGFSLITGGNNNGTPLKTPQGRGFVEGGGGIEINIVPELMKLFVEGKYTQILNDKFEGIDLNDGRKDGTFNLQVGARYIFP